MVHPSIIAAHSLVRYAKRYTDHAYDSDYYPKWITQVSSEVEETLKEWKIQFDFLPTSLEDQLIEAVTDWMISENIQAEIDHESQMETERSLMPGRW